MDTVLAKEITVFTVDGRAHRYDKGDGPWKLWQNTENMFLIAYAKAPSNGELIFDVYITRNVTEIRVVQVAQEEMK